MPASNNTEKPNIAAVSWDAMPRCMLSEIGKFAGKRSSLSRASRTTLKAIPAAEVHLKIDTVRKYKSFFEQGFYDEGFCGEESQSSLIDPATGGLKSGRVVAHITVTAAMTSRRSEETPPPWHSEVRVGFLKYRKYYTCRHIATSGRFVGLLYHTVEIQNRPSSLKTDRKGRT